MTETVLVATVSWAIGAVFAVMSSHKRILLLGPTGVDKKAAVDGLASYVKNNFGHTVRYVDFEHDFLMSSIAANGLKSFYAFLAQDSGRQAAIWKSTWQKCASQFGGDILVLGLHATYVSGIVGLRCPIDLPSVCEHFDPTLVVTLIDDVQNMWFRTESRAQGKESRGRPSLEQLLIARRAEELLGDIIVAHSKSNARHLLVATTNAMVALANLVIFNSDVTYLSFPISAPRRMSAGGDRSFIDLLNKLHRLVLAEMQRDHKRSFITPLAIDELPMTKLWEKGRNSPVTYLDTRDRWLQSELWGSDDQAILPPLSQAFEIPGEQIEVVAGIIGTDVGWRDRRLVLQSKSLAICCPKDPAENRITRGVRTELDAATAVGIVTHYWQDPKWDPQGFVDSQFSAGSMGAGATEALVQSTESMEALVRANP